MQTKHVTYAMMVLLTSLLLFIPVLAHAGWFMDFYLGGTATGSSDIKVSSPVREVKQDVDFDGGFVVGGRAGYWFPRQPALGLALDISYFSQEVDSFSVDVMPVSALLWIQFQLDKSDEYPYGRYVPYIAFGPSYFMTKLDFDIADLNTTGAIAPGVTSGTYSDQNSVLGFDGRAGMKFRFAWNLALFGEYRYTFAEPSFSENVLGTTVDADLSLQNHFLSIGLSYDF